MVINKQQHNFDSDARIRTACYFILFYFALFWQEFYMRSLLEESTRFAVLFVLLLCYFYIR